MGEGVRAAFGLAGGLALFLFGMENMSRALQQAAGERMRGFLRRITRTPFTGALAGLLVTAVLQSSSATTVMVIGFVSAGLMELPQAVAVVFGANVGTTMTAQLVAFRLADWVFPILFAGVLVWLLARRERTRQLGLAVFSFGLLFDGIEVLSGAMAPLAEHPVFLRWMTQVRHTPLLGLLLGTGMTLVVQSSSATIAVLQRAAQQAGPDGIHSVLGLAGALPILLGGQHRHDHHGGAGGGGSAYGCPADGGSALLLQPVGQRGLPADSALDDKAGGGRLTQGAGAGSAGAADRQRPHPVQPAVHTGVAPADAGDGPAGLQTGAAAPKLPLKRQNRRFFCKESRLSIDKGSRLVVY